MYLVLLWQERTITRPQEIIIIDMSFRLSSHVVYETLGFPAMSTDSNSSQVFCIAFIHISLLDSNTGKFPKTAKLYTQTSCSWQTLTCQCFEVLLYEMMQMCCSKDPFCTVSQKYQVHTCSCTLGDHILPSVQEHSWTLFYFVGENLQKWVLAAVHL